jgi:FixJ family two-component response regulator
MSPVSPIIHIVDDDKSFRTAVGRVIAASGFRVASYGSGDEILAHLPSSEPGCILLDLQMPGLSGAELQDRLAEKVPLLPIVFLTGHGDIPTSVRTIKAGAEDFIEKPVDDAQLLAAINRCLAHSFEQTSTDRASDELQGRHERLTPREAEVMDLVVQGFTSQAIALKLEISQRTVESYRVRIMEKMQAESVAVLVRQAIRLGRITP